MKKYLGVMSFVLLIVISGCGIFSANDSKEETAQMLEQDDNDEHETRKVIQNLFEKDMVATGMAAEQEVDTKRMMWGYDVTLTLDSVDIPSLYNYAYDVELNVPQEHTANNPIQFLINGDTYALRYNKDAEDYVLYQNDVAQYPPLSLKEDCIYGRILEFSNIKRIYMTIENYRTKEINYFYWDKRDEDGEAINNYFPYQVGDFIEISNAIPLEENYGGHDSYELPNFNGIRLFNEEDME